MLADMLYYRFREEEEIMRILAVLTSMGWIAKW